jgi:hypothetical protein
MHPSRPAAASVVAVAILLSAPRAVAAPPKAQVQTLLVEAARAMKAKQWAGAITALRQARKIERTPEVDLNLGAALAASGKLVEARRVMAPLAEGAEPGPAAKRAREAAKKALSEIQARLAVVEVTIVGPPDGSASAQIDGLDVDRHGEILVDPGDHTVGASAEGFEGVEKELHLAEGAHERVELKLASKAPPPAADATEGKSEGTSESKPSAHVPVAGVTITVLGAVNLVASAVFGGIALKAGSDARAQCSGNLCPPAASGALSQARTFGNAATALFVAGGAITSVGVGLIIAASGSGGPASARLSPWVGPGGGGAGVRGTF